MSEEFVYYEEINRELERILILICECLNCFIIRGKTTNKENIYRCRGVGVMRD